LPFRSEVTCVRYLYAMLKRGAELTSPKHNNLPSARQKMNQNWGMVYNNGIVVIRGFERTRVSA
ncbi:MAG: hypothetical protein KDD92_13735, partial [Caldilineaceae bacterium]|nr:hypothetical protein [Caldilineaceae bacterium]